MVTILDQTWINQFQVKLLFGDQKMIKDENQDRTVILISVAFSTLNYVIYIPELVMVGYILCPVMKEITLEGSYKYKTSETERDNSIPYQRPHGSLLWG